MWKNKLKLFLYFLLSFCMSKVLIKTWGWNNNLILEVSMYLFSIFMSVETILTINNIMLELFLKSFILLFMGLIMQGWNYFKYKIILCYMELIFILFFY